MGRPVTFALIAVAVAAAVGLGATLTRSAAVPVLGAKTFSQSPYAYGWGKVAPRNIFNGGDPSGLVKSIKWRKWGGSVAVGVGLATLPRQSGGYYPGLVTVRLRASNLGRCSPRGPLAYRRLAFREPIRPGGRLDIWRPWSDTGSICHSP
jgi:hypothetical protein